MSAPESIKNETEISSHSAQDADATDIPASEEQRATASFRESKISFAVDVSGSTYGPILRAEQRAIKTVSSLIPHGMHPDTSIIPWTNYAYSPIPIKHINSLQSGGGTNPNVLLENPECRLKLQESEFWFLMTDGVIEENLVRAFARNLTDYGMHGKACIVSVFGERILKPADCCISVGLAVFAVSPHVAFLYTDIEYDVTYVLCTKGCFSNLLHGRRKCVKLDHNTSWNELPQISYEDLTRISVPKARTLGKDELALQGDLKINMSELFAHKSIDEDIMRQIMFNEDNRRTLANTAKLRGEAEKLTKWLGRVENTFAQPDVGSQMIQDYEKALSSSGEKDCSRMKTKKSSIRGHIAAMKDASRSHDFDNVEDSFMNEFEESEDEEVHDLQIGGIENIHHVYLANAGFLRPTHSSQRYSSTCPLCGKTDVLAILLTGPAMSSTTDDFPEIDSQTRLIYPLTMGNYPESEIISDTLACDPCSAKMVKSSDSALEKSIIGALPLVSYAKNQDAWIQTLNLATSRRFSRSDTALVFLGIAFTKRERLASEPAAHGELKAALAWLTNMIQSELVLQSDTIAGIVPFGAGHVDEVLLRNFRDCLYADKFPLLMSYPLDGFIVANAALSNSKHSMALSQERRKAVVFLRFLFHLLESFVSFSDEHGEVQSHAAKTLVLLLDDPSGPRSLFKWDSLRKFSFYFKSLDELQRHLRENVTLDKYKLSLTTADLLNTPLLSTVTLDSFRRLGPLFSWIESECGHAIAVFVHHLMRFEAGDITTNALFTKLRNIPEVKESLVDPGALSARVVDRLIKGLPALES